MKWISLFGSMKMVSLQSLFWIERYQLVRVSDSSGFEYSLICVPLNFTNIYIPFKFVVGIKVYEKLW